MEDLISSIPVLVVTAIIIVAVFWFTNRSKKQKDVQIRQLAEAHHWTLEPINEALTWGHRIKTPQWIFESYSQSQGPTPDNGSSNISQSTTWMTTLVSLPENNIYIGPGQAKNIPGEMGSFLMQAVLQKMGGAGSTGLEIVPLQNAALNQKYMVLAHKASDVDRFLTPLKQKRLLDWSGTPPVIRLSPDGLLIRLDGERLEKPDLILAFIQMGEVFMSE